MFFLIKLCGFFFFFKQKTAYEMRISDWSSDVCSSDLQQLAAAEGPASALDADAVVAEQPIFDLAVDHGDAGVDLLDLRDLSRRRLEPDEIVEAERRRQPRHRTERRGEAGVGGREGAAAGSSEERRGGKEWVRTVR